MFRNLSLSGGLLFLLFSGAGANAQTNGAYGLQDGSYVITLEFGTGAVTMKEPGKISVYTQTTPGVYTFTNPTNGLRYGLRVIDDQTVEAFQPGTKMAPDTLVLLSEASASASADANAEAMDLAEHYRSLTISDPDNVQVWATCSSAALASANMSGADADRFIRTAVEQLKLILVDTGWNPCSDVISPDQWGGLASSVSEGLRTSAAPMSGGIVPGNSPQEQGDQFGAVLGEFTDRLAQELSSSGTELGGKGGTAVQAVEELANLAGGILDARAREKAQEARRMRERQAQIAARPACLIRNAQSIGLDGRFVDSRLDGQECQVAPGFAGDLYSFEVLQPEEISVALVSDHFDPIFDVVSASGSRIAGMAPTPYFRQVGGAPARPGQKAQAVLEPGTYFIRVHGKDAAVIGEYGVNVSGDDRYTTVGGERVAAPRFLVRCEFLYDTEALRPGDTRRSATEQRACNGRRYVQNFFIVVEEPQRIQITIERDQPASALLASAYNGSWEVLDVEIDEEEGRARLAARVKPGIYFMEVASGEAATFTVSVSGRNSSHLDLDQTSAILTRKVPGLDVTASDLSVFEVSSDAPLPSESDWRFSTSFEANPNLRLVPVLTLHMSPAGGSVSVPLGCTLFDEQGNPLNTAIGILTPAAGATEVRWSPGPMSFDGRMFGGVYRVLCVVDDRGNSVGTMPLASTSFEVWGAPAAPSAAAEAEYIEAFNQGTAFYQNGDLPAAERAWERALTTGVPRGEAPLNLGILLFNRGEYERSLELAIQAAEAGNPEATGLLEGVSSGAFRAAHRSIAARGYEYLANAHPTTWAHWYNWANVLYAQQEWEALIPIAERALELDPSNRNIALILAAAFRTTGQLARATEMGALAEALKNIGRN